MNAIAVFGMKETTSELHGKYQAFSQLDFQQKQKGLIKKG